MTQQDHLAAFEALIQHARMSWRTGPYYTDPSVTGNINRAEAALTALRAQAERHVVSQGLDDECFDVAVRQRNGLPGSREAGDTERLRTLRDAIRASGTSMLMDCDDHNAREAAREMREWADQLSAILADLPPRQLKVDENVDDLISQLATLDVIRVWENNGACWIPLDKRDAFVAALTRLYQA